MTLVEQQTDRAPAADAGAVPRPTPGAEWFGEYQGSGYAQPHYLVRRADGQVVQLTRLLELVLRQIDGFRDLTAIAAAVTDGFGRDVGPDDIAYLVEHMLRPAGLVEPDGAPGDGADAGRAAAPRANPLLALSGRRTLVPARYVRVAARRLGWLHRPSVVAVTLGAAAAFDAWLFGVHGAVGPLVAVISHPVLLLATLGLGLASMVFHEFGHASACSYSGARPGRVGFGIYLIWPSLYTDVTDAYRLPRAGRLRTDLGGVYFNVVFIVALAGCYAFTGQPFLLAAILLCHTEIIDQLLPVVRLDGYFILTDLAGVPDLFGRIRPTLTSLLPGHRGAGRVADLRRGARVVVGTWIGLMVPMIAAELVWLTWHLPGLTRTTVDSVTTRVAALRWDAAHARWADTALDSISVLVLVIPAIGLTWFSVRVADRAVRAGVRRIRPAPRGRHRR